MTPPQSLQLAIRRSATMVALVASASSCGGGGKPRFEASCSLPAGDRVQSFECRIRTNQRGTLSVGTASWPRGIAVEAIEGDYELTVDYQGVAIGEEHLLFELEREGAGEPLRARVPVPLAPRLDREALPAIRTDPRNHVTLGGTELTASAEGYFDTAPVRRSLVVDWPLAEGGYPAEQPKTLELVIATPNGRKHTEEIALQPGRGDVVALLQGLSAAERPILPGAAESGPGSPPHPALIVWSADGVGFQLANGATRLKEVVLLAIAHREEKVIETCKYDNGALNRYRRTDRIDVYAAATGDEIASKSFTGPKPRRCEVIENLPPPGLGIEPGIRGEPATREILAWLARLGR